MSMSVFVIGKRVKVFMRDLMCCTRLPRMYMSTRKIGGGLGRQNTGSISTFLLLTLTVRVPGYLYHLISCS